VVSTRTLTCSLTIRGSSNRASPFPR
jgi:hypothetical protein